MVALLHSDRGKATMLHSRAPLAARADPPGGRAASIPIHLGRWTGEHPLARARRRRSRPRPGRRARLEVGDQPRPAARRALRRTRERRRRAPHPRHRADGRRPARPRRPDRASTASTWPSPAHDGLRGGGAVDCGLAGTVMRFVPPAAALADGPVALRRRPPRPRTPDGHGARRAAGARRAGRRRRGCPFTVHGTGGLPGGEVVIDASASSQFVSGLLLSGARYDKGVTVRPRRQAGAVAAAHRHVRRHAARRRASRSTTPSRTPGGSPPARSRPATGPSSPTCPTPRSSSPPPRSPAARSPSRAGRRVHPARRGDPAGARAVRRDRRARAGRDDRHAGPATLSGVDVDLHDVGELTPTVAALAALATGPSRLRGVAHIRGHETDRLAALATELTALGGDVEETADGLVIRPAPLRAGRPWRAYADHRMATAGALSGWSCPASGSTTCEHRQDHPRLPGALGGLLG